MRIITQSLFIAVFLFVVGCSSDSPTGQNTPTPDPAADIAGKYTTTKLILYTGEVDLSQYSPFYINVSRVDATHVNLLIDISTDKQIPINYCRLTVSGTTVNISGNNNVGILTGNVSGKTLKFRFDNVVNNEWLEYTAQK